jgi:4-amino-4-deoxy-L-arabinose transferase-like glycosyltransferase
MQQPISKKTWLVDLSLLFIALTLLYALFLGSHPLVNPDEARYSGVAREMLVTGDFVTPKVNGVTFFDKPILYYWLQASSMAVFGVNEWSMRLWPALLGIVGCLFVYTAGRLVFNRRTGLIGAFALATSVLYYGGSHFANMDLEVAVFISGSLLMFLVGIQDNLPHLRKKFLYASYLLAGLAILTKGLIGIVFPMMIIGLWILFTNQWSILKRMCIWQGIIIIAVVVAPWLIAVQLRNPDFLYTFFYIQHFERFVTENFNSQKPFWFYVPLIVVGLLPFTGFALCALSKSLGLIWREKIKYKNELFLIIWPLVIFLFFSIPTSKLTGYILPVFPPLILLTAVYLDKRFDMPAREVIKGNLLCLVVLFAIGAVGAFVAPYTAYFLDGEYPTWIAYLVGTSFLVIALVMAFCLLRTVRVAFIALCILGGSMMVMVSAIAPHLKLQSTLPLIEQMLTRIKPEDQIVAYYSYFYDVPTYSGKRVFLIADWDNPKLLQKDNWRGLFANGRLLRPETQEWLIKSDQLWSMWQQPGRIFMFVKENRYSEVEKITQGKLYHLGKDGEVMLLSNQPG